MATFPKAVSRIHEEQIVLTRHDAHNNYHCSDRSCPCWADERSIISEPLGAERAVELDPASGTLTILDAQHGVTLSALQVLVLCGFLKEHEACIALSAYAALESSEG